MGSQPAWFDDESTATDVLFDVLCDWVLDVVYDLDSERLFARRSHHVAPCAASLPLCDPWWGPIW
jgi:hypothetical protein